MLLTSVASLGVNAIVLYVLLHPRAERVAALGPGMPDGVTMLVSPAGSRSAGRTSFEYVDHLTGRRMNVVLPDDGDRLLAFLREGHLSPAQEAGVRGRYEERRRKEAEAAEAMARTGEWRPARIQEMQRDFWYAEWRRLPPDQTAGLSPAFFPPPGH